MGKQVCDKCRGDAIVIHCSDLGFHVGVGDPRIRLVCVGCQKMVGNCSCLVVEPQDYWQERIVILSDYLIALGQSVPSGPLGSTHDLMAEYEAQVKKCQEKWSGKDRL